MPPNRKNPDRPVFLVGGREFVSAGVIVYTQHADETYLLFGNDEKGRWTDFGGKSEPCDATLLDVALRECSEELNSVFPFTYENLQNMTRDKCPVYYWHGGKYAFYFLRVDPKYLTMTPEEFGLIEKGTGWPRRVSWVTARDFVTLEKKQIHPRLRRERIKEIINRLITGQGSPWATARSIPRLGSVGRLPPDPKSLPPPRARPLFKISCDTASLNAMLQELLRISKT